VSAKDGGYDWVTTLPDLATRAPSEDRLTDAAAAVAELDAWPTPCDSELVIKRHTAHALLAARRGEPERGLEDARAAVAAAQRTSLVMTCAYADRTHAELLAGAPVQ
jgi:hypothetical protein